jgi:hypothetical protein
LAKPAEGRGDEPGETNNYRNLRKKKCVVKHRICAQRCRLGQDNALCVPHRSLRLSGSVRQQAVSRVG